MSRFLQLNWLCEKTLICYFPAVNLFLWWVIEGVCVISDTQQLPEQIQLHKNDSKYNVQVPGVLHVSGQISIKVF